MSDFITDMILDFFIAFGVVLGACMMGAVGSVLSLQPPTENMLLLAERIKIWAMVAAIGGTIDPIRVIESHVAGGDLSPAIKQIMIIVSAFMGAHLGATVVHWIAKGGGSV